MSSNNAYEQRYINLVNGTLAFGVKKQTRAGLAISAHHGIISADLSEGFPVLTGKKIAFGVMAAELECFIKGLTDISEFKNRGCNIWDKDLSVFNKRIENSSNTNLGNIYGKIWRGANPGDVDQLQVLLDTAKRDPMSRRLIVTAWHPTLAHNHDAMALPPCHLLWQISIRQGTVDLCFYMRSVDLVVGLPFDMASYSLLLTLIAKELDLTPGIVTGFLADCHVYEINVASYHQYLANPTFELPSLVIVDTIKNVVDFNFRGAYLEDYRHSGVVKVEMASE